MVSLSSLGVYAEAEKTFKKHERHLYSKMLDTITNLNQITHVIPENILPDKTLSFWFKDVFPLMFDANQVIQDSAIKAVEAVIPVLRLSSYQDHAEWPELQERIIKEYSNSVIDLREKCDSNWYKIWNVLVLVLNKKLLKGSVLINKFLAICEQGFKSVNLTVRAETFLCWKVLLEIYSQDTKYLSSKRIKLLLVPFKPVAKSSQIASNKLTVWWSLICKVQDQIEQHYESILLPFLCFCFSLSDKPILTRVDDEGNRREEYPELIPMSVFALVNILGPVNDATKAICKSPVIEQIHSPLVLPKLLETTGRFVVNSCGEATWYLKDIELIDAIAISDNLWTNLLNRMVTNKDSTLVELIVQNLTILVNEAKNDESAKRLMINVISTVLSSKNLIPIDELHDDVLFSIMKRIYSLLCSDVIHINDNILEGIILNVFVSSTDRLKLQPVLSLLQLQTSSSNARVSLKIWMKTVINILDNRHKNDESLKKLKTLLYEYVAWPIKYLTSAKLSVFLPTWNNLVRWLKDNDSDLFWEQLNVIFRNNFAEVDTRNYCWIVYVFGLVDPKDPIFPTEFKSLIEFVVQLATDVNDLLPVINEINNFSQKIIGKHSMTVFKSLDEMVKAIETKFHLSKSQFSKFHQNYGKFLKTSSAVTPAKQKQPSKDDDFVFFPSKWQFRPENLTDHQKEKMKEKRVDIPALYNDLSQSQDSQSVSLKPWAPKTLLQPDVNAQPVNETKSVDVSEKRTETAGKKRSPTIRHIHVTGDLVEIQEEHSTSLTSDLTELIDIEERKRRRVQNELNKLTLDLKNSDQFKDVVGRTRRKSSFATQSPVIIRKRSRTTHEEPTAKRGRTSKPVLSDSVDNSTRSNDDSSEIIEASQPLSTTPSAKERRASRRMGSSKKEVTIGVTESKESVQDAQDDQGNKPKTHINTSDDQVNSENRQLNTINKQVEKTCERVQTTDEHVQKTDEQLQVTDEPVHMEDEQKQTVDNKVIEPPDLVNPSNKQIEKDSDELVNQLDDQMKQTLEQLSKPDDNKDTGVTDVITESLKDDSTVQTKTDLCSVPDDMQKGESSTEDLKENVEPTLNTTSTIPTKNTQAAILQENTSSSNESIPETVECEPETVEMKKAISPAEIVDTIIETTVNKIDDKGNQIETATNQSEDKLANSPIKLTTNEILTSPPLKPFDVESHSSSSILASPSSNQNNSKTTELLNSTIDISPILHTKTAPHHSKSIEKCCANLEPDEQPIKITDLDSLIKPPMDSPMVQPPKKLAFSTPQSTKGAKKFARSFQLQGRGAKLLQLMNIRKIDEGSKAKTPMQSPTTSESVTPNSKLFPTYEDILANNKDIFRFCKALPSPQASPSNSIMKRSLQEVADVNEDVASPQQKRKRVSFHDPPVSATKEFVRYTEEVNPNRNRFNRNNLSIPQMKNILMRKNRTDSLNEIKNFSSTLNENDAEPSLKWDANDDDDAADAEISNLTSITFADKNAILQHVFQEYSIDDLLRKYLEFGFTLNNSAAKSLTKHLSNVMVTDEVTRKDILEEMSDKFSSDFLDVTLQENLRSTVFDRLSSNDILNYISERAEVDEDVKMQLMEKLANVVDVDASTAQNEMKEDLYKILMKILSHKMTEKQLIQCLDVIFEKRRTNNCS